MKRLCLPLLMICLLLTACGGGAAKSGYEEFAAGLADRADLGFTAKLRCEYEDKTVEFTVGYSEDENGCTVSVLEPKLIAGIKAHAAAGETKLEYDGVILDTGELDSFGLAPMSAAPLMMDALRNGHLESYWQEDGKKVFQLVPSDELTVTVWLEPATMTPMRAELSSEGHVVIYCDIIEWR